MPRFIFDPEFPFCRSAANQYILLTSARDLFCGDSKAKDLVVPIWAASGAALGNIILGGESRAKGRRRANPRRSF